MLEEFERCLDMPRLNRCAKQGEDSFTGDRIVRRVTLHWQGSNRGAWTSTVPNNDLPRPPILQRLLFPTSRAASPDLAVLLSLRLNKMALQAGQDRLGLCK
jgi:hypothetical protein